MDENRYYLLGEISSGKTDQNPIVAGQIVQYHTNNMVSNECFS